MPIKITCNHCKHVLYEDAELVSPKDIIDKYDSKCPKCSSVLTFDPSKLTISVSEADDGKGLLKIFKK